MLIESYIIEEARDLLRQEGIVLPIKIPSAPSFWLAATDDDQVVAFAGFEYEGATFKIGTKKLE